MAIEPRRVRVIRQVMRNSNMHGQNIQTAQLSIPSFSLRFSSGKFIGQLFFIFLAFFLAPRKCGTNLRELVHTNDTNVYRIRPNNYLHKVARKPSNSWGATVADPEGRGKFTLLKWKRMVFFCQIFGRMSKKKLTILRIFKFFLSKQCSGSTPKENQKF